MAHRHRPDLVRAALNAVPAAALDALPGRPRFNVVPSQAVAVIRLDEDGDRALGAVGWGLVPHWATEPPKVRPINARAETVATSGMFRQAFARRRCIVPADFFYEWRTIDGGTKQPTFVRVPDDRVFGLAGGGTGGGSGTGTTPLDTCAVVTTTPNGFMAAIHDRMPVILRPDDYAAWPDRGTDPREAARLLRPYPDDGLEAVPVGRLVNSPRNDVPECVRPAAAG